MAILRSKDWLYSGGWHSRGGIGQRDYAVIRARFRMPASPLINNQATVLAACLQTGRHSCEPRQIAAW